MIKKESKFIRITLEELKKHKFLFIHADNLHLIFENEIPEDKILDDEEFYCMGYFKKQLLETIEKEIILTSIEEYCNKIYLLFKII